MFRFVMSNGQTAQIFFSHKGGKRGDAQNPGKAPTHTLCTIVSNNELIGKGVARPTREFVKELPTNIPVSMAQIVFGRRLLRTYKTHGDSKFVLLKGDNFSRKEGRKASLKKALQHFNKEDRRLAWAAIV